MLRDDQSLGVEIEPLSGRCSALISLSFNICSFCLGVLLAQRCGILVPQPGI